MANGTRTWTLVIVLVLGIAVGWLACQGQKPPTPAPQPTPVPTSVRLPTPGPTPVCAPGVTPTANAKNWNLTVGPDPCQVKDENGQEVPIAVISKQRGHKIVFQSNAGQDLAIVIHVPRTDPKPFKNMALAGYDQQGFAKWALFCDDPKKPCSTGPAQSNAVYACYKYDQILDGKECDAGIIIEP